MDGLKVVSVEQLLKEVGVAAAPGEKLQVMPGDSVKINATIDYRGPTLDDYFYGAIGNREFYGFDEVTNARTPISFPASDTWRTYSLSVDVPAPGRSGLFDLYVKIMGHLEAGLPEIADVIEVLAAVEFRNFAITSYEKV